MAIVRNIGGDTGDPFALVLAAADADFGRSRMGEHIADRLLKDAQHVQCVGSIEPRQRIAGLDLPFAADTGITKVSCHAVTKVGDERHEVAFDRLERVHRDLEISQRPAQRLDRGVRLVLLPRDGKRGDEVRTDPVVHLLHQASALNRQKLQNTASGCAAEVEASATDIITAVRINTDGGDAMLIDQVQVYRDGRKIFWDGRDNGGGYCLSTDAGDTAGGWEAAASGCSKSHTFSNPA